MTTDTETTEDTAPEGTDAPEATEQATEEESTEATPPEPPEDAETFPRAYVERLRREAAGYRERAGRADDLARRLHTALVTATGRLADPTDLPYDEAHLDDETALTTALDELLTRKPHLASRRVHGDVGQGATASGDTVDLAGILRARA